MLRNQSSATRRAREKEAMRIAIMDAALDLAKTSGWASVSIRRISDSLEYTTSILYAHYKNKEDLLASIADRGFELLYTKTIALFADNASPSDKILKLSLLHWDFATEFNALYELMFRGESWHTPNATKGALLIENLFEALLPGQGRTKIQECFLHWLSLRQGGLSVLLSPRLSKAEQAKRRITYHNILRHFVESYYQK